MTVLYVLAHFDDEYCALPLIRRDLAQGRDARFIHLVDYPGDSGLHRQAETLGFLAGLGVGAGAQQHLGRDTGWLDGEFHRHAKPAYQALAAAAAALPAIERLVTPAWEGGHPDHDVCAAMTVRLAADMGGLPVDQFSLYQGKGLPWLFFRASRPLPENGPTRDIRLSLREWGCWAWRIRAFPSQLKAWAGLAPAMALTFLVQGAFRYQRLDPARIAERPHAGPLLYERMFATPYATVRAAVDGL